MCIRRKTQIPTAPNGAKAMTTGTPMKRAPAMSLVSSGMLELVATAKESSPGLSSSV